MSNITRHTSVIESTSDLKEHIITLPSGYKKCSRFEVYKVKGDDTLFDNYLIDLYEGMNGERIIEKMPVDKFSPIEMGVNFNSIQFCIKDNSVTIRTKVLTNIPAGKKIQYIAYFELEK